MNYNTDGFNERTNYIHNANDANRLAKNGPSNFDNSFAKMRTEERRNMVETTNNDQVIVPEEVRGSKESFILRNNAMNNVNHQPTSNNPVSQAMNRNMFNQFKK